MRRNRDPEIIVATRFILRGIALMCILMIVFYPLEGHGFFEDPFVYMAIGCFIVSFLI